MSKIKSAMEWNTLHTIVPKDVSSEDFWMIYDLAESYADYVLKAKLESITDELIDKASSKNDCCDCPYFQGYEDGAKWLKQKLLKDEQRN